MLGKTCAGKWSQLVSAGKVCQQQMDMAIISHVKDLGQYGDNFTFINWFLICVSSWCQQRLHRNDLRSVPVQAVF